MPQKTRWGAVAATVLATIASVTPAFAVGALVVPITSSLGTNAATFGFCLSGFFAFTAIGSPLSAGLAERIGAARQLAAATAAAGIVMAGCGFVSSVTALAALLAAGGLANSLVQPAAGLILGSKVSPGRLSLASGMMQAALAAPPLTAGLLVRFLAEPYGWRIALTVGGVLIVLSSCSALLVRREEAAHSARPSTRDKAVPSNDTLSTVGHRILLLWSAGAALGTVGVTATASFFVPIAVGSGVTAAMGGLLALGAGALAAFTRVTVGLLADQRPRNNVIIVICMMLVGSVGLTIMSLTTTETFLIGIPLVVVGLWGWNGLMVASAVRLVPRRPARAVGSLQVGFFLGATAAPLLFGALSLVVGVKGALLVMAASAFVGASVVAVGELYLRHWECRIASKAASSRNKS